MHQGMFILVFFSTMVIAAGCMIFTAAGIYMLDRMARNGMLGQTVSDFTSVLRGLGLVALGVVLHAVSLANDSGKRIGSSGNYLIESQAKVVRGVNTQQLWKLAIGLIALFTLYGFFKSSF